MNKSGKISQKLLQNQNIYSKFTYLINIFRNSQNISRSGINIKQQITELLMELRQKQYSQAFTNFCKRKLKKLQGYQHKQVSGHNQQVQCCKTFSYPSQIQELVSIQSISETKYFFKKVSYWQQYIEHQYCYKIHQDGNLQLNILSIIICGFLNHGNGTLILVNKQKQSSIDGFTQMADERFYHIKDLIQNSINRIKNKQDIQINIQFVAIVEKNLENQENQFVIRVNVSKNFKQPNKIFGIEEKYLNKPKKFKVYQFKLARKQKMLKWQLSSIQNNYQRIVKLIKNQLNKSKLIKNKQQFMSGVFIDPKIQQKLKIKKRFQPVFSQQKLFRFVCQFVKQKNVAYQFPIEKGHQVIFLIMNRRIQKQNLYKFLQEVFNPLRIIYNAICPLLQLQQRIIENKRSNSVPYQQYYRLYLTFNGKQNEVQKLMKKLSIKLKYSDFLIFEYISEVLQINKRISQSELEQIKRIMLKFFKIIPKFKKIALCNQKSQIIYRHVEFSFQKQFNNAAIFLYFILHLSRMQPRCDY